MDVNQEVEKLNNKIQYMEKRIKRLRIGRRVLMHLVESIENEKNRQINNLSKEVAKLKRTNKKYAQILIKKNINLN